MGGWLAFWGADSLGAIDWATFDWSWLNTVGGAIASVIGIAAFVYAVFRTVVYGVRAVVRLLAPSQGGPVLVDHRPAEIGNKRKIFGRDKDVAALRDLLQSGDMGAVIPVPTGGGGVGKTSLCRYYARVHADDYDVIRILRAGTEDELVIDLASLAKEFNPALTEAEGVRPLARHALSLIAEKTADQTWLLVYDNVERPQLMQDWGARGRNLHVLVTSRWPDWTADGFVAKPLEVLEVEDAIDLLRNESGRDDDGFAALAEHLGRLPLSLVQAGEWLAATPSKSPADYVRRVDYLSQRIAVPGLDTDLGRTTAGVVQETLGRLSADALALARIFAWYAPDQLRAELVSEIPEMPWLARKISKNRHTPKAIYQMARSPEQLEDAMQELRQVALLEGDGADDTPFRMHRDFQRVIRADSNADKSKGLVAARGATAVLAVQFPSKASHVVSWPKCRALLPHVQALWRWAEPLWTDHWDTPDWAAMDFLLNQAGIYLSSQSDVAGAIDLKRGSLKLTTARLGEADRDVPLAMGNLAINLANTGRSEDLAEAQRLINEAVALDEVHREGGARSDLAGTYMQQASIAIRRMEAEGAVANGAEDEAEQALEHARAIREELFGAQSAEMSHYWNTLGYFRKKQDKQSEALAAYRNGFETLKTIERADAGQLATRAMNFGSTALELGAYEMALAPLQEAYDLQKKAFAHDPGNPRFLTTCGWLIDCHFVRDRAGVAGAREEAAALCEKHGLDAAMIEANAARRPLSPPEEEGGGELP
ncbi:hypothetical protein [Tateyamaria sp. SN6-1]|uniref:hypothetical protein n=1 Tax=Tateyamaria sp. SN6-1 TaxID=3092148 RepID=UPI0039F45F62